MLFLIESDEYEPSYVEAANYQEAVEAWKADVVACLAAENEEPECPGDDEIKACVLVSKDQVVRAMEVL